MSDNFAISADYPGPARSFVEDVYGDDCVVGFLLGCHGDIRPNYTDESGRFRSAVFAELEREGRIMGAEVVKDAGADTPSFLRRRGGGEYAHRRAIRRAAHR